MTASTSEQLAKLMSGVELLMLDFDGPICSVFARLPAAVVAERLRRSLRVLGVATVDELTGDDDPLSIYRASSNFGAMVVARLYAELVSSEIEAVSAAEPTPGAVEVVRSARANGKRVAIVSNNSAAAIHTYLSKHSLGEYIDYIAASRAPEPSRMKPAPDYVLDAAKAVGIDTGRSVLVGDSVTDIEAAKRAGARAIGFANKPGKASKLARAGADDVVLQMLDLVF